MFYDPDGIDKAASACEKKGGIVMYGGQVKKIHDKQGQATRILISTNCFITYVKKPKNPSLSRTHYWSDLSRIDIDNNRISLTFKKDKIRFVSPEAPVIARKIIDAVMHTTTPQKLSKLDLDRFPHPQISINPFGVFTRFDEHLIKQGLVPHDIQYRNSFRSAIFTTSPRLAPRPLEDFLQCSDAFFFAIVGSSFTKSVFLPKTEDDQNSTIIWRGLSRLFNAPSAISFVNTKMPLTPEYSKFANTLKNKNATNLIGLGFGGRNYTEDEIEKIKGLAEAKLFNSLRFRKFAPLSGIMSILAGAHVAESLRYLSLDKTKNLDLQHVLTIIPNIVVLSLAHCDLEIVEVFRAIEQNNGSLRQLRFLNLSGNDAKVPFDEDENVFQKLQRIDICRVKFGNGVLKNVLEHILTTEFECGLRFFCDKLQASKEDFDDALENFAAIPFELLYEFSWKFNPVSNDLFDFVSRNTHLNTFYLHKNFTDQNRSVLEHFVELFPYYKGITHFIVTGNEKKNLGDAFPTFVSGLKNLPNLRYLDISGHFFKEEGVKLLGKELPSLKKLTHLSFENSGISSFDPIHELIKTAEGLHKKMKISWPSKDLQNIYKAKKVSSDELTDLKAELHSISTGLYDVLQSRRASVGLDEAFAKELAEKIKDSPPAKRGSFRIGSSRNKKTSSSEFIRAGSVRNIKRPLLDKSSTEQDPDSIFIKPFEAWLARVKGEFPEFYNEELEHEFPLTNIQLSEQEQREIEAKNMMKPHNHDDISEQSSSSSKKSSKENIITRDIKLEESDSDKLKNPKPRKLDNKEASSSSSSSVEKRKKIPKKDFGVTVDTINKPPPQDATDKIIPIGVKKEEEKKKSKPPVPLKVIQPMPPKRKIKAEAEQPEPPKKEEKKPKKVEPVKKVEKKETPKKVTPIKKIEPVKKVEKKESPKKDNAKPAPQLKPVDEVLKPLPEVTQIEKPPKEEKPEKKKPSPTKKTTLKKVEPVKKVEKKVTPIKKLEPVKKVEKKKEPKVQTREVEIVPDEPLAHLSSSSSSSSSDENIPKKEQPAEIKTRDVKLSESSSSSDDEKKEAPKKEEKPVKKEEKPVKKETPKKVEPKKEEKKPVKKVEKKEITPKKPSQKRRPEPELGEEVSVLHNKIIVEEVSSLHVSSSSSSSSSSEDEAVIIPRAVSPKTGRTTAPDLDIENPHLVVDDLPEAVTFEAPSWTFPIPRTTRVSNKHLVKELEEKYSTHAVINALKSTK